MKKIKEIYIAIVLFLLPFSAFSQGYVPGTDSECRKDTICEIITTGNGIIDQLSSLPGLITIICYLLSIGILIHYLCKVASDLIHQNKAFQLGTFVKTLVVVAFLMWLPQLIRDAVGTIDSDMKITQQDQAFDKNTKSGPGKSDF